MLCSHKNNNNKSLQNYTYFKDIFCMLSSGA